MNNKFNYIINHFKIIYGIDFPLEIAYGVDNESKIQIRAAGTGFFGKEEAYPQNIVWREWDGRQIPFLFENDNADEIVNFSEVRAVINYEIISAAFDVLSGWEEHKNEKRDGFGRFPFGESIQYREKIIELPVVNYYFDILKCAVEKVYDVKLNINQIQIIHEALRNVKYQKHLKKHWTDMYQEVIEDNNGRIGKWPQR